MIQLYILFIFIIGLLFGSLTTVLIERWRHKKGGILFGRSECPVCHHTLGFLDLFPLFSYIFIRGRCRHCQTKISWIYPLSEVTMGIIFVILSTFALEQNMAPFSMEHCILLLLGFITGVYILYDIRYLEIPDQVMIPGIVLYTTLLFTSLWIDEIGTLFFDIMTYIEGTEALVKDHFLGAFILYSFLYIQILIPGSLYAIRRKEYRTIRDLIFGYLFFPIVMIIDFFRSPKHEDVQNEQKEEVPSWVGGGDLRIAIFIGLTLGSIHGITSFAFAYILGSIVGIILLLCNHRSLKKNHEIPFGPFLGVGWMLSLLFYEEILSIAENYLFIV